MEKILKVIKSFKERYIQYTLHLYYVDFLMSDIHSLLLHFYCVGFCKDFLILTFKLKRVIYFIILFLYFGSIYQILVLNLYIEFGEPFVVMFSFIFSLGLIDSHALKSDSHEYTFLMLNVH